MVAASWIHVGRQKACWWRLKHPVVFYGALLFTPVGVGWVSLQFSAGSQVSHKHLRAPAAELEQARLRTKGIGEILAGLPRKSTREKLEAVHDGATRTHEIGFGTDESSARQK